MSFSEDFKKQVTEQYPETGQELLEALNNDTYTSVRLNPAKPFIKLSNNQIPWTSNGYFLPERPQFTLDALLHAGVYYVQESSSMFIEHILKSLELNKQPLHFLDLCAAPGGKSTLLSSCIHPQSVLVANEVIKSRSNILAENLQKWGNPNIIVTNNDARDFLNQPFQFDCIVVDAPCSGEGMFRKDHNARNEWSADNVELCAQRQQRILHDIWDSLKPGGVLIYSTCTFNTKENEAVVSAISEDYDVSCLNVPIDDFPEIERTCIDEAITYRFLPHKVKGEGFAVSIIKKHSGKELKPKRKKKGNQKTERVSADIVKHCEKLVSGDSFEYVFGAKDTIYALSKELKPVYESLSGLRQVYAGIPLGSFKKKKIVPHPSFAFSSAINKEVFPIYKTDKLTSLKYFKKESLILPDAEKGWLLLEYAGVTYGVVNNLGNRANNPYPQEWKIKMNIPDELPNEFWKLKGL